MSGSWVGIYPAVVVDVADYDKVLFDLDCGWGISIKRYIRMEYSMDYDKNQKIFLKRRLENFLKTITSKIMVEVCWDDGDEAYCDVLVGGEDLITLIEDQGILR